MPPFLRSGDAVAEIATLGPEADRLKGAGREHDAEHDPGHYLDTADDSTVGGVALEALPPTREAYDTALRAAGTDQYKQGYLPYQLIDGWQQLRKDLAYWRADAAGERLATAPEDKAAFARDRALRETLTLRDLGYWSHFVADASQPLHDSIHFNGWGDGPNPSGYSTARDLHSRFETSFVRATQKRDAVAAVLPPYRDCGCSIEARVGHYLAATHAQVVPLYELEKTGAFDPKAPLPTGVAFAQARLAAGAAELRDMVIDAWRQSADLVVGYPGVKVRDIERGTAPLGAITGLVQGND